MAQKSWAAGEPLVMMDLPTPSPGARQVRVKVAAASVNPVDWKMRKSGPLRLAARVVGPRPPVVPGVDFAGTVEAVGDGVTGVKLGDAVAGGTNFSRGQRGSYSDTVVVEEDQVCVLPAGFDLDVAGALGVVGATAWMSVVEMGRISRGKRVAVLGASGAVGQLCVQVARHLREAFVAGVCSARNVDLVRELGAHEVADYGKADALTQLAAWGKYDLVVDCAGGYSGRGCRALLAPGGIHVMVAGDTPAAMAQVLVPPFSSRAILGVITRDRLQPMVEAVASGQVKLGVARRFPLAAAEEATALSQGGRMTGKIVLNP
jgi:NADPH:quinone reductase-like Zn-dependent oxidoreductase